VSRPTGRPRGRPRNPFPVAPDPARRHMRYLDRLIALGPPHEGKRADWAKFCSICGTGISMSAAGVRTCGEDCEEIRGDRQHEMKLVRNRETDTRRSWRGQIQRMAESKRLQ